MKQIQFEERYRSQCDEFAELLMQLKGKKTIEPQKIAEFTQRYRRLCQLLSIAKQRCYSANLVYELNELVIQGHQRLYHRHTHYGRSVVSFVTVEFPALVRQEQRYFWSAVAVFYLPAVIFSVLIYFNDVLIYSVFPPEQVDSFVQMYDPQVTKLGRERQSDTDLLMFGHYIMNNIGIGFRTFASGLLLGAGSIFFLAYNGVVFGAVAGYLTQLGFSSTFYSFISGHCSLELTAIIVSGAAGVKLGWSLVSPGQLSRLDSLKSAASICIKLVYGAAGMLVLAAFVEAFWSANTAVSHAVKYFVALGLWAFVIIYFVFVGKEKNARHAL